MFQLDGAHRVWRSYASHTITGMSCVKGSTQLTVHLQSPVAAAAAQQEAEAAAAAADADPALWTIHEAPGCKSLRHELPRNTLSFTVPPSMLAAFGDAWQQRGFKVQLSVHKDGVCCAGGPGARINAALRISRYSRRVYLPRPLTPQLAGCHLTVIKAAAPHHMQVHLASTTNTDAAARAATAAPASAAAAEPQSHTTVAAAAAAAAGRPRLQQGLSWKQ
ncbi:hypothetical protein COO60DRAFT_489530 [Scenedesmus sp. NREL 46B-D3]|nr:hypothetical protein COO60DRAFT_489530 [Scenedesmus sp. NREL 46B-D3]